MIGTVFPTLGKVQARRPPHPIPLEASNRTTSAQSTIHGTIGRAPIGELLRAGLLEENDMKRVFIAFGFVAAAVLAGCTMSQTTAPERPRGHEPDAGKRRARRRYGDSHLVEWR